MGLEFDAVSPNFATTTVGQTEAAKKDASYNKVDLETKPDTATFSNKKEYDGPKIGFFRLAFGRLTEEQLTAVNRSGKLPKNAKFIGHSVANNILNIIPGTSTLPAGYELRKGWFGFTRMVLKDTEGFGIRKKRFQ